MQPLPNPGGLPIGLHVIASPTPTSSLNSDLKSYTNTQHNFSFKYPADFTIQSIPSDYIPPYNLTTSVVLLNKQGFHDATAQYSQDANFSISSSTDTADCYSYYDNNALRNTPLNDQQTINGAVYYVGKSS